MRTVTPIQRLAGEDREDHEALLSPDLGTDLSLDCIVVRTIDARNESIETETFEKSFLSLCLFANFLTV